MSESGWTTRIRALTVDDLGGVLFLAEGGDLRLPAVEVDGTDDGLSA